MNKETPNFMINRSPEHYEEEEDKTSATYN